MIAIFTGLPGSGKSALLARTVVGVLYRNERWYKKQYSRWLKKCVEIDKYSVSHLEYPPEPQRRMVYTNLKLSAKVEERYYHYIAYWTDLRQLTPLRDVDVVIDEVATYFDSRLWETLSLEMRRWLAQHRKFGIEIYGTAQDFAQVDKAFRRLTSDLIYLRKLVGTRDISPTRPAPKWVFVVSWKRYLDPTTYDEQKSKFASKDFVPHFMVITRQDVEIFDTRAEVVLSKALPLKHIERVCENNNCSFHKVQHV